MKLVPIIIIIIAPLIGILLIKRESKYLTDSLSLAAIKICLFASSICLVYLLFRWNQEVLYLQNKFTSGKLFYEILTDDEGGRYKFYYFTPEFNFTKYLVHGFLVALFVYGNLSIGHIFTLSQNTFFKTEKGDTKRWRKPSN